MHSAHLNAPRWLRTWFHEQWYTTRLYFTMVCVILYVWRQFYSFHRFVISLFSFDQKKTKAEAYSYSKLYEHDSHIKTLQCVSMCFNDSFIVLFHCVLLYNVESSLVWPLFEPFSRRVETINQSVKQELGEKFEFSFGTKMETKIKQHDCIFWLNYTWLVAFLLLNALNDFANGW